TLGRDRHSADRRRALRGADAPARRKGRHHAARRARARRGADAHAADRPRRVLPRTAFGQITGARSMTTAQAPAWLRRAGGGSRRPRRPAWGKLIALALVFAALAAAWRFTPVSEHLTAENIGRWARA